MSRENTIYYIIWTEKYTSNTDVLDNNTVDITGRTWLKKSYLPEAKWRKRYGAHTRKDEINGSSYRILREQM